MSDDPRDLHVSEPRDGLPWVSYGLIAACIVVALLSSLGRDLGVVTWLTVADLRGFDGGVADGFAALAHGQLWRLFTPILIHFGLMHLVLNLFWLKDLGGLIERAWSARTLILLVAGSAAISNLAQYVINWDFRTGVRFGNALSGGMSGVVYCLLGYVWLRGRAAGIALSQQTVWMMLGWLVLCFTGAVGAIANTAHLVGLLVGVAWGWVAARRPGAWLHDE